MKNKKLLGALMALLLIGGVGTLAWLELRKRNYVYHRDEGFVFGTVYHLTYAYDRSLQLEVDSVLASFNASLSPFNKESVLSRINNNDPTVVVDEWCRQVFVMAKQISETTGGAFDITVAPLVNAWGFGFKEKQRVTPELIDSILPLVGYKKIQLVGNRLVKQDPRIMIDASAIAKGYASDVVGDYLRSKGVDDYMVEIGGEIACRGVSPKGRAWNVGINRPVEDSLNVVQEIEMIVPLKNCGMATSGNYRNFYYENGRRFAHTIDPRKGYPIQHDLLSTTVIAPTCIEADAYATAFMVLGREESKIVLQKMKHLEVYFIYEDEVGLMQTEHINGR